jgi:hypothetical protein
VNTGANEKLFVAMGEALARNPTIPLNALAVSDCR